MKGFFIIIFILLLGIMINAQNDKTLIADGTTQIPIKYSLAPTLELLSAIEIEAVKNEALRTEINFKVLPQMSAEESNHRKDFELLDVAEGWFISREMKYKAYLYTAWSEKINRNYQGIIVLKILNNGTKFVSAAHYVYQYRGDKFIRQLPDINQNMLSELAIFSEPPSKKELKRFVRIIEFSPNGIVKIGSKEIYIRVNQKQRLPYTRKGEKPAKRVYTPPDISAIKLFANLNLNQPPIFSEERWRYSNDFWGRMDKLSSRPTDLDEDSVNYVEIIRPAFPNRIGEK